MPKSIVVDPQVVRKAGSIEPPRIPLNQYRSNLQAELARFGADGLKRIWLDMVTIREFETMLNAIKLQGAYQGIEYNHRGPAHLSIGQEAAAVGQCASLEPDDHIYGSHRSHGEILAKGLSAIAQAARARAGRASWSATSAARRCASSRRSRTRARVETWRSTSCSTARWPRSSPARPASTRAWAARCTPSSRRSASCPTTPSSAARRDIAVGAALFKQRQPQARHRHLQHRRRLRWAAGRCGKAMCFATMDQFKDALGRGPSRRPAAHLQLRQQLLRHGRPARRRDHGLQGPGPPRRRRQPRADARRARGRLQPAGRDRRHRAQEEDPRSEGDGPVLLDTVTYRFSGHSPSDASSYRDKERGRAVAAGRLRWSRFADDLVEAKVCARRPSSTPMQQRCRGADPQGRTRRPSTCEISPRADLERQAACSRRMMFSNQKVESHGRRRASPRC